MSIYELMYLTLGLALSISIVFNFQYMYLYLLHLSYKVVKCNMLCLQVSLKLCELFLLLLSQI